MEKIFEKIDKIFLLNLDHRTDRLRFQKKQFWDLNIDPFFRVSPVVVCDSKNFLNKSVLSCYLSHLNIIEQIIKENIFAIILEDDSQIVDLNKIRSCLDFLFSEIRDWDMFYFYTINTHSKENIVEKHGNIQRVRACINTHAYLINKKSLNFVYETLINYKQKIDDSNKKLCWNSHVDQALAIEVRPYLNVYSPKEDLIIQNKSQFESDIDWHNPD